MITKKLIFPILFNYFSNSVQTLTMFYFQKVLVTVTILLHLIYSIQVTKLFIDEIFAYKLYSVVCLSLDCREVRSSFTLDYSLAIKL